MKLFLCLSIQNKLDVKHFALQNAFPNGTLTRSVYEELPAQLFEEKKRKAAGMRLQCPFYAVYRLKNESKMWFRLMI